MTALKASKSLNVELDVSIESFVGLVKTGIEVWSKAGEMLVRLVQDNPGVYSEIIRKNPTITFEMLLAFERIGRKQIYPPLLMDNSVGAKRLLEMSYETQEKFCKEPIEVVIDASNGEPTVEKKHVKELTDYETRVVFDRNSVRSVSAQAEFVKTHNRTGRKPRKKNSKVIGTYIIKVSPSGGIAIEKAADKLMCPKLVLYERDGVKQCAINIADA